VSDRRRVEHVWAEDVCRSGGGRGSAELARRVYGRHCILMLVAAWGVGVSGGWSFGAAAEPGVEGSSVVAADAVIVSEGMSEASRLGLRVVDGSLSAADRHQAAQELWRLGESGDLASRDEIRRLIESDADAAGRLVRAAAGFASLRCWSVELIVSAGERADVIGEAVSALSVVRTRAGAGALIELGKSRAGVEDAVVLALSRLTMHPKPPTSIAGWEAALEPLLGDSESWSSAMVGWAFAEAERARSEVTQLHTRLGTALRRQFAATTGTDERTALLASWLGDPMPMIRGLAVELAQRELVNARPLGAAIGQAAVQLLQRPEASARRDGAQLLASVAVDPAPISELALAIEHESDVQVAAAMLETATRWPSPVYSAGLLRWVSAGGEAVVASGQMSAEFISAVRLARSMLQSGWMPCEHETEVLLLSLRSAASAGAMSPSAMQVLAKLGNDADRRLIYAVAVSADAEPARRTAAARALAEWSEWTGALVDAAGRDGALFDAACDSAARFAATPEVVARLATSPDVPADRLAAGITRVASSLDVPGRVSAAGLTSSAAVRVLLLSPMSGNGIASVATPAVQVRGLTLLAESQLGIGEASQAWATALLIEKSLSEHDIASLAGAVDHERAVHAVLASAVAAGRVERFESLSGSLRAWLSAIERAPSAEVASQTAGFILRRFSNELEDVVASRLRSLANPVVEPKENSEKAENPRGDDPHAEPDPGAVTEPNEPEDEPTIAGHSTKLPVPPA